jgi:hypothetical protein
MLGFVLRRRERRALDVGCCTQHLSQHVRNIVATWGRGERLLMLDVTRNYVHNMLTTRSQHARNMYSLKCCKHHGSQHGKTSSQHCKSCSQHHYASQQDRRLIHSLIWIVRSQTRPMLELGSDVRALAVPSTYSSIIDHFWQLPKVWYQDSLTWIRTSRKIGYRFFNIHQQ